MISNSGLISLFPAGNLNREKAPPLRVFIDNKRSYFLLKRSLDIIASLIFIIAVLSWLLPVLAILISITSKGPIFFMQQRVGRGGKTFTCYKFRTMIVNKDADKKQAIENDRRVTGLGRFLRKSNIDEFPQFINVLMGDMSIVGPRPHMHADCYKFSSVIPGYKFRNMVKPGITGLAQVKGYHGTVTSMECMNRRYQWDAFYIRNINFWLDVRILFTTAMQRIRYIFISLHILHKVAK